MEAFQLWFQQLSHKTKSRYKKPLGDQEVVSYNARFLRTRYISPHKCWWGQDSVAYIETSLYHREKSQFTHTSSKCQTCSSKFVAPCQTLPMNPPQDLAPLCRPVSGPYLEISWEASIASLKRPLSHPLSCRLPPPYGKGGSFVPYRKRRRLREVRGQPRRGISYMFLWGDVKPD